MAQGAGLAPGSESGLSGPCHRKPEQSAALDEDRDQPACGGPASGAAAGRRGAGGHRPAAPERGWLRPRCLGSVRREREGRLVAAATSCPRRAVRTWLATVRGARCVRGRRGWAPRGWVCGEDRAPRSQAFLPFRGSWDRGRVREAGRAGSPGSPPRAQWSVLRLPWAAPRETALLEGR